MNGIDLTRERVFHYKKEFNLFDVEKTKDIAFRVRTALDSYLSDYPWDFPHPDPDATLDGADNAFGFSPWHNHYGPYMTKPGIRCDMCGKELTIFDFYCLCSVCEREESQRTSLERVFRG